MTQQYSSAVGKTRSKDTQLDTLKALAVRDGVPVSHLDSHVTLLKKIVIKRGKPVSSRTTVSDLYALLVQSYILGV